MNIGTVYLTGAGPGDEGLITLRAKELIGMADAVVYDYLVNPLLLSYCKPGCEKIYVGKRAGIHSVDQAEINGLLVKLARQGLMVVRLKGGDPYVFGRGGEEALNLKVANIPFEVVPGVTSGIAAPAYAGIPVTHRCCGSTLTFITGHKADGKETADIDWHALAALRGTLVFYMGISSLQEICNRLIGAGKQAETPVALIRYGTWPSQQTLFGTLADIPQKTFLADFKPPALIVVGESVLFHDQLGWFSQKAMLGKRILVTRSREQASELCRKLREKGADVTELPTISISPMPDYAHLHKILDKLATYSWIVFTSVNGVSYFFKKLYDMGLDSRALASCKIAAIGSETIHSLSGHGIKADLAPEKYTSEALAESFGKIAPSLQGKHVLISTSLIAREYLPEQLRQMGASVDVAPVYQNQPTGYPAEYISKLFEKSFDLVTFTSSSTVDNFVNIIKQSGQGNVLNRLKAASIGPVTSQTARNHLLDLAVEAPVHTIPGLVEATEEYFKKCAND